MEIYTLTLSKEEATIISELTSTFFTLSSEDPELFCKQAKELSARLPKRIQGILQEFAKCCSPTSGILLFKGFDTNADTDLYETPSDNMHKIGEKTKLSKIQGILMSLLGQMIAYEAEGGSQLFQDIVPNKSMANNQSSIGSHTELEIHTEQAFSKLRPDFLSLACLRGDPEALTYIIPLQSILDNLTEEEAHLLTQPLWTTSVDLSFRLYGRDFIEGDIRGPMPILSFNKDKNEGKDNTHELVFDQDLMRGTDTISQELIHKITKIYYQHRIAHNLQSGEILFIDNRIAVHGRSPFFPKYDGKDRFLIRCFATLDYSRSEYARINGSRIVAAIYS
jgi:L-asparagine oxygenase